MMEIGLLVLLAIISIPILLVFALAGGAAGFLHNKSELPVTYQQPVNTISKPIVHPGQATAAPARFCAHCGTGLQAEWTHCPQCGAPVNSAA